MWNTDDNFVFSMWPDAQDIETDTYTRLMQTAHSLCVAYAPVLPVDAVVPETWKLAEIFQARHLWGQAMGGNRQEFGPDGMVIPVYPLVFAARDLLRPATSPLRRLR